MCTDCPPCLLELIATCCEVRKVLHYTQLQCFYALKIVREPISPTTIMQLCVAMATTLTIVQSHWTHWQTLSRRLFSVVNSYVVYM